MPRYRFGVFDFDSATGELRREGERVRLQAQPGQVLAVLLERAGKLVSRDALREAVWGKETHVDFERGLNFCISQIRSALRDSADSPVYVRTVPKQGYEFVAPVELIGSAPPEPPATKGSYWKYGIGAAAVLLLLLGAVVVRSPSLDARKVAIFRLDNDTGDPQFDRTTEVVTDSIVAAMTEAGLRQPAGYAVIGNAVGLRKPRAQRDLLEVGKALGAGMTLSGSIRRREGVVEVFVQLIRLPEQTHLRVVRIPMGPESDGVPLAVMEGKIVEAMDPILRTYTSR